MYTLTYRVTLCGNNYALVVAQLLHRKSARVEFALQAMTLQRLNWLQNLWDLGSLQHTKLILWACSRKTWLCQLAAHQIRSVNLQHSKSVLWACITPTWLCGLAGEEKLMYSSFGASCSEVEINMLTGERRVLRADIMLDAGNSLSPAIDAGQASLRLISLHQHQNAIATDASSTFTVQS